jgi:hydroxyacylglutathione hydrolase
LGWIADVYAPHRDTLFLGGCGRFFEGTADEMRSALTYLSTLPDSTIVYNGHEYTAGSAKFGHIVDPDNSEIQRLVKLAKEKGGDLGKGGEGTTGQTTIGDEKKWNVFMRLRSESVEKATGVVEEGRDGDVKRMQKLREMKNSM